MTTSPVITALTVFVEVIISLIKFIYYSLESTYRLFFPVAPKSVKDELILVTGAGHGIGRELAIQLSHLGARLALWDLDLEKCEQTAKEVRQLGGKAQAFQCDVSNREQVLDVAGETRKQMGSVNILINNAGIMACQTLLNTPERDIRRQFDVNVLAHFWTLEAFLPDMKRAGKGHIVALSSMAGVIGLGNLVPYCATKFAVRGLMESLAEELRVEDKNCNIDFTTIYPFIVNTGLVHKPRIKHPSLLQIVSPRDAAAHIINAFRRNYRESSIPSNLLYLNHFCRMMPAKGALLIRDMLDSGCDAHDN